MTKELVVAMDGKEKRLNVEGDYTMIEVYALLHDIDASVPDEDVIREMQQSNEGLINDMRTVYFKENTAYDNTVDSLGLESGYYSTHKNAFRQGENG